METTLEARPAQEGRIPDGSRGSGARSPADAVALAQGVFYVATGAWAVLDADSFQDVTGPKTDVWLVKTVGALVAAVGGALAVAGARGRTTPELAMVGAGCAAALAAVDTMYVADGTISPVYLLDAAAEVGLVAAWGAAMRDGGGSNGA